jgi:hypothetical protein
MMYRYSIYKQWPQPAEVLLWVGFGAHGNQATSFIAHRGRSISTYYSQNYWISGLCPSSGILKTKKHNVSETGSVSVLRGEGKTPTLLGPIERTNLNHWTIHVTKISPF